MLSKALADLRASGSVTVASAGSSLAGSAASRKPGSLTSWSSIPALAAWVARWVRMYGPEASPFAAAFRGDRDVSQ